MDLKQRKRIINSIPRFNTGNDRSDLAGATKNLPSITGYVQQNVTSIPTYQQISTMKTQGIQGAQMQKHDFGSMGSSIPSFNIGQKPDYVSMGTSIAGGIGDLFSQSGKFGDKTSSAIRNYGGAAASMAPGKYGQLAQTAVTLLADTIGMSKYKHTADEMRNNSGMSNSTINGINYTTQNALDTKSMYSDVKDTAIKNTISNGLKGSVAGFAVGGPIGAVVGGVLGNVLGIFGGRKAMIRQKRINRNAQMQNLMLNQGQMAYADTEALQNKYYQDNYDTTGQLLYANNGKDIVGRKRLMNITKV